MITLFKEPFFGVINDAFESSKFENYPKVNVTKNEIGYKILMSVPGLTKEDLKITVKDSMIEISHSRDEKDELFYFIKSFSKSYSLPDNINEKDIQGKVENGVLELILPINRKRQLERVISLF